MNLTDGTVRAQAGYTYDTAGRVATVGDGGDTLTYAYAPGTGRVASSAWTTATGNDTAYTYDNYKRLTGIAVNNQSVYGYTLNDKDQRTAATLENGDNWAYTYDTLGQLTGALKKDSQDNTLNNMSYAFDLIGNRTSAVEDATNWTYASNLLNQYTQVNALLPTYDADGNMLTWNDWTYTWNGENRLVCAENDDTKVEMSYDYMGRRFEKKVYTKGLLNLYTWTLQKHRKFAYDGYKLIAEFDAMNNDALLANYLWQPVGLDVPLRATIDGDACYFVADGNKNIIALKDATAVTTDDYTYTPFGAVTASGSIDNPFRFSSEYHDAETDLVYYNFRYYNPTLGRWIKRDSIEEEGGNNLYVIVRNDITDSFDDKGLWMSPTHRRLTGGAFAAMILIVTKEGTSSKENIKESFINIVVEANVDTDSGEYESKFEYHYTRDLKTLPDNARMAYSRAIEFERGKFNDRVRNAGEKKMKQREADCKDALSNLGRLTHMWQDYYAHAVETDDSWFGATPGKLTGNPDNPKMIPVSFGGTSWGFRGGHGGAFRFIFTAGQRVEPGDRAEDAEERRTGAQYFTRDKLVNFMNNWLKPCHCVYDKM